MLCSLRGFFAPRRAEVELHGAEALKRLQLQPDAERAPMFTRGAVVWNANCIFLGYR